MPLLMQRAGEVFGPLLSAFGGMSANAMSRAFKHLPGLRSPFPGGKIPDFAMELTRETPALASEPDIETLLQEGCVLIAEGADTLFTDALFGPRDSLWRLRHSLTEGLRASGYVAAFDLSFEPGAVGSFRSAAIAMLAGSFPDACVCDFGHVGDGGVHFNLVLPTEPNENELERLRRSVLDLAVFKFGGSFSGEHGLGRSNAGEYRRYVDGDIRDLAARLLRGMGVVPMGSQAFLMEQGQASKPLST